nr:MAG TPA: hypothetical protein [Caudoviricetes sp.]
MRFRPLTLTINHKESSNYLHQIFQDQYIF